MPKTNAEKAARVKRRADSIKKCNPAYDLRTDEEKRIAAIVEQRLAEERQRELNDNATLRLAKELEQAKKDALDYSKYVAKTTYYERERLRKERLCREQKRSML